MIVNVISGQSSGYTNPNPFPGMSLAEACGMAQAYTADALNEMNMSILLNEHAYLLENGTEIQYVNEANYQLKEKIKTAIDKVSKTVSDMWDKLVNWVQDRVEDVRELLNKAGINKKKLDDIIGKWQPDATFEKEFSDWVEKGKLSAAVSSFISTNIDDSKVENISNLKSDIRKAVIMGDGKFKARINKAELTFAEEIVFNTDRSVFNEIRKAKAAAMKVLNDTKKDIKEANDDDKSDQLKAVNLKCRYISLASSELIKWYHSYVGQYVNILKFALKNKSIAKNTYDVDKALDKAMHNMAKETGENYDTIKQRFTDGDINYTKGKIMKFADAKAESAIFSGDRFFPVY